MDFTEYKLDNIENVSGKLMKFIQGIASGYHPFKEAFTEDNIYKIGNTYESGYGTTQDLFLLPRKKQQKYYVKRGYIKGKDSDYGLVKSAVGNNNYPVYQKNPDQATRDELIVVGNEDPGNLTPPHRYLLYNANSHPAAFYINGKTGEPFYKSWDLLNYGRDANGNHGSTTSGLNYYNKVAVSLANILDKIGSPTVTTSGFIKGSTPSTSDYRYTDLEYLNDMNSLLEQVKKRYSNENSIYPEYTEVLNGKPMLILQEVTVKPKWKLGGKFNYLDYFK